MSKPESELYSELIRNALIGRAGKSPDAGDVAEATLHIWHQMVTWLAPVIGVRGVEVLFSRTLHLTSRTFPQLIIAEDQHRDNTSLLVSLKVRLIEGNKPNDAIEASFCLLVTFTEQLSILIGKSLTEQLLRPVWTLPSPTSEQETAQ